MAHLQCYSLQNALYKVFVRPTAVRPHPSFLLRTLTSTPQYHQKLTRKQREERGITPEDEERIRKAREKAERKAASKADAPPLIRQTRRPVVTKEDFGPKKAERLPENDEIKAPAIDFVDKEGKRHVNVKTADILWNLDRAAEVLVTLKAGTGENRPLCKVFSLKELLSKQRQKNEIAENRSKEVRDSERREKEVEMTWLIGPGDLTIKMAQMCRFLSEDRKVTVTVSRKHRRKAPDMEAGEMEELIEKIKEAALETGAREVVAPDGKIGESLILVFERKPGGAKKKESEKRAEETI